MTLPVYVLNGPNLNLIGSREPEVYGRQTLSDIEKTVTQRAKKLGLEVVFRQSNHEGELVDWVQEARTKSSGVIINAGAYSHTSIALLDAFRALDKPVVEVHLSNLNQRERYRHHSYISSIAKGVIMGFGAMGYVMALDAMATFVGVGKATLQ
jgi:3-dehydroquinate dehydratase-2